jgi:hypothetical protein
MAKHDYYQKLFNFLESRFSDGETFKVQNYFETYSITTKDKDGKDKVIYGIIAENGKTYLSLNDLGFPKKLYKREIRKVDNEETTEYTQMEDKIFQGDCAILFDKFKKQYKDSLTAMDLLYLAMAKHNDSEFVSEAFIYPTECFQRFKGEYTTGNFYLFNFKIGGIGEEKINEIFADICKIYEDSLNAPAEATAEATEA